MLKKYKAVLLEFKKAAKDLAVDHWTLVKLKGVSTDNFCPLSKSDGVGYDGDSYLLLDKCVEFKKYIWFELRNSMWRKHGIVFLDHLKYICNEIVKPFCVGILHHAERVQEMHELAKNLSTPLMKGNGYEAYNWKLRDKELSVYDIQVAIKDGIPSSMQDELEDNQEVYRSLAHKDWCGLFSTTKVKDNRKRDAIQINKLATFKAASLSDSNNSTSIPRKKNSRTCVCFKQQGKKTTKKQIAHNFCVLCKKS